MDALVDSAVGGRGRGQGLRQAPMPKPAERKAEAEDKSKDDGKRRGGAAGLRAALHGELVIAGAADRAAVSARLRALVSALPPSIKSLAPGTTGTVKLRLTLDAAGRVTRVAFVSGSLMLPSLKTELTRLLGGWAFGVLPEETSLTFTLRFS